MNQKSSISVIIPAYNSAKYLSDAINSILQQTMKADEIIVVDDGSTDDTEAVLKKFKGNIRTVYQENAGTASARNRGLQMAQGDIIGFLDADDIWLKNKLELQLNLFQEYPEYETVIGLLKRIPISKTEEALKMKIEDGEHATSLGSSLIKKQVFEKIGNFDDEMRFCDDVDLFLRIQDYGIKVLGHNDVVQLYRRHDQNITLNIDRSFHDLLRVFKKTVDRRRESGKNLPNIGNMSKIMEFWQP